MSKARSSSSFLTELLSVSLYKRSQGQQVRQVTGIAIAVTFLVAAWSIRINMLSGLEKNVQLLISGLIAVAGCWLAYRIVNFPKAADFMIAVQGEMEKVSWPTWGQLWRATIVVLFVMVLLSASLFAFDIIWRTVFSFVGFLKM